MRGGLDDDSSAADLAALAGFAAQAACAHLLLQASTTLRPGESLLVHGAAGGVGGLAVQIAKALGAGPVIGTASTAARREFVMALGADAAISYDEPGWTEQVRELTAGRGVDVLIESIGGEVFEQNFDALATFGRYLLLGSTRGPGEPFAPRRLMTKSQALIGFYLPVFYDRPELIGNALRFVADGLRDRADHVPGGRGVAPEPGRRGASAAGKPRGARRHRPRPDLLNLRNTMTTKADHRAVPHTMNRIDISTGVEFDDFIAAFEKAAPPFDPASVCRRSSNAVAVGTTSLRPRRSTRRTT